jgi:hypothetical protein
VLKSCGMVGRDNLGGNANVLLFSPPPSVSSTAHREMRAKSILPSENGGLSYFSCQGKLDSPLLRGEYGMMRGKSDQGAEVFACRSALSNARPINPAKVSSRLICSMSMFCAELKGITPSTPTISREVVSGK